VDRVSSPALQQPLWPDRDRLEAVVRGLEGLPPLVLPAECDQLKERLAA
jgi:3-deoxy-7-phosphoheptulonate synthase